MNIFSDTENSGMTLMIIATSLCNKYEEWKNDSNIMKIVDVNKNSICVGLKNVYPTMDMKVMQSIALAFTMYFVILLQNNLNEETNQTDRTDQTNQNNLNDLNGYFKIDDNCDFNVE